MSKKSEQVKQSATSARAGSVIIQQPTTLSVVLEVTGTADLIQSAFAQKAIEEMLRKHMGISVQREKKKPREAIEAATIRNVKGDVCMSPVGFKLAMLSASATIKSLKKTQLRMQLYVEGNSIPISYTEMRPRMDIVRLPNRAPDVRFRPSFIGWKAPLVIQFSDALTVQTVVDLLNRAGRVGVGEWRPEKNGTFGTFAVTRNITDAKEIAAIRKQCAIPLVTPTIPEWALDMDIDPSVLAKVFDNVEPDGDVDTDQEIEMELAAMPKHHAKPRNGARA